MVLMAMMYDPIEIDYLKPMNEYPCFAAKCICKFFIQNTICNINLTATTLFKQICLNMPIKITVNFAERKLPDVFSKISINSELF